MALFGGKNKEQEKAAAEAYVRNQLSSHPAVSILLAAFSPEEGVQSELMEVREIADTTAQGKKDVAEKKTTNEKHSWLTEVNGYYDDRFRTVVVGKDYLGVFYCKSEDISGKAQNVGISFTALGFTPLPSYIDPETRAEVDIPRVAEILAETVRAKLREKFPDYYYTYVFEERKEGAFQYSCFEYRLPALTWKKWF